MEAYGLRATALFLYGEGAAEAELVVSRGRVTAGGTPEWQSVPKEPRSRSEKSVVVLSSKEPR